MHSVSVSSSCHSLQAGEIVDSEKDDCGLKTSRSGKDGKTNNCMERQNPDGSTQPVKTARACTIRGKILSLKASGKRSLRRLTQSKSVKEKTNTWNKSRKEIAKTEPDMCKMFEKQEQKERGMTRDLLEQLQKRWEEEDEARGLIEEMQRNLDEAQNRSYEVERKLDRVLWKYFEAFDKDIGRPQLIMTELWQMMQSRDTKNQNLDRDFEDIIGKV